MTRGTTKLAALIAALGLLAAPLVAEAQQAGKISRVGVLSGGPAKPNPSLDAFRQSLLALGWVEGRNVTIEARFADGKMDRLAGLALDLVRLDVQVIVAGPSTVAQAARQATTTIPIVHPNAIDPLNTGLIVSLAHPGGNLTGGAQLTAEVSAKRLEILKKVVPGLSRVATLWNSANSAIVFSPNVDSSSR